MITKGIIKELPVGDNNKYIVEIPIFSSAGMTKNDLDASYMEATLCYQPGILNSFNVGDVVFIGFEDNKKYKPIILGKLFLYEDVNDNRGYALLQNLEVNGNSILSKDTSLGDITVDKLEAFNRIIDKPQAISNEDINNLFKSN